MNKKKLIRITLIIISFIIVVFVGVILYGYFYLKEAYDVENKPYKNYIGYIDKSKALLNNKYKLCDDGSLYYTYSGAGLIAYKGSKKQFRDNLNDIFNTNDYTESGYLNFRFLVNCEGKAGWFEIIEMDLDLKEKPLNDQKVKELFKFTSDSKNWNIISYEDSPINYYMYTSYRIENGKITEIIP